MKKKYLLLLGIMLAVLFTGCSSSESGTEQPASVKELEQPLEYADIAKECEKGEEEMTDYSKLFKDLKITQSYKKTTEANPLMTQSFGADPYAMAYGDTLYIYMTQDVFEKDGSGEIKENTYSKIQSIHVVSTKDMVNFEDHGEIKVAGNGGACKWAKNSWAPAAAWKEIDGKPRFFLYFADGGGGIGVLQSDSPTGPFEDPIGSGLVTRNTPTCDKVLWLFDPAVLVDDDGRAYLYCGGGVPEGKAADPGTGRVVELGEDMISLKGDPVEVYAPYLFEDSGIHKANGKYYYTYCSNFSVDAAGTEKFGFESGEIIMMESDSPMGPFHYKEMILENPGKYSGLGGNNHHCVFQFENQWYITYHTRLLEKNMGVLKGYRSTSIEKINIAEDGSIGIIPQTLTGCEQFVNVDAYTEQNATMMACQAGIEVVAADANSKTYGCGRMAVGEIDSGDFTVVRGVDFGHKDANTIAMKLKRTEEVDDNCVIQIRENNFKGDTVAYIPVTMDVKEESFVTVTASLEKKMNGVHDLYFVFCGKGYEVLSWQFV